MQKPGATLGERIEQALLHLAAKEGRRVTVRQFGARVAKQERRKKPFSPAAVSDWTTNKSEPALATIQAIARVAGVSELWLAFNRGEMLEGGAAAGAGRIPRHMLEPAAAKPNTK